MQYKDLSNIPIKYNNCEYFTDYDTNNDIVLCRTNTDGTKSTLFTPNLLLNDNKNGYISNFCPSANNNYIGITLDVDNNEKYLIFYYSYKSYLIDVVKQKIIHTFNNSTQIFFQNNNPLEGIYYIKYNKDHRPYQLYFFILIIIDGNIII